MKEGFDQIMIINAFIGIIENHGIFIGERGLFLKVIIDKDTSKRELLENLKIIGFWLDDEMIEEREIFVHFEKISGAFQGNVLKELLEEGFCVDLVMEFVRIVGIEMMVGDFDLDHMLSD